MLAYIIGVVLFALGLGVSVALHEAGHMWTAKMFGMKVRRYFIGFGPRIWSFRRGGTEYGFKAIPAGGFCDIAGMTALDEVSDEEAPRAMWRYPTWKRFVVMVAGSVTHFIIGFIILYVMATSVGLPNVSDKPVVQHVSSCARSITSIKHNKVNYAPCGPDSPAPAQAAGMRPGDEIVSVAGKSTPTWSDVVASVQHQQGPTPITVRRGSDIKTLRVDVATVRSIPQAQLGAKGKPKFAQVGAIGIKHKRFFQYGPAAAVAGAGAFTGQILANAWTGLRLLPQKLPALLHAIAGGQRDPNTPVSIVGVSRFGGQAVQRGLWPLFWLFMALFNIGIGVINLVPLLPLDGGHVLVIFYERVRDWVRKLFGKVKAGPVDYAKLAPVTLVVIFVVGAYMLIAITADIVNPLRIGGQ